MDPLSITGLVLQVIEVAAEVYKYGKEVQNASKEMRELFGELFALKAILEQISKERQDPPPYTQDSTPTETPSSDPFLQGLLKANTVLKEILEDLQKRQNRGQSFFKQLGWPGRKAKLQENITQLERLKSYFILVMMNENSAMDKEISFSVNLLNDLGRQIKQDGQEELHRKIREWICPVDMEASHRKAQSVCHAGTGHWFIDGPFQQWFQGKEKTRLLYLEGKCKSNPPPNIQAGSGKTVLWYFCPSIMRYLASQKLVHILGALLAQLSEAFPEVLDKLKGDFNRKALPTSDTLLQLFLKYACRLEGVFIFLDAANESNESEDIMNTLLSILNSGDKIHVMITSTAASVTLGDTSLLRAQMRASSNRPDIRAFVSAQLEKRPALRHLPSHTKGHIADLLIRKANGMFRYVQCQIDILGAQRTGRDVRIALEAMPEGLNGTYEVILAQISSYDRELAREILVWLTFSREPLTLSALSEAVVISKGDKFLDGECRLFDPTVILKICQGLAIYDERTSVITLAHSSVPAYLTSEAIRHSPAAFYSLKEDEAARCIYQKCLTYLMFHTFRKPCSDAYSLKKRLSRFPLLQYAAATWAQYCGSNAPAGFKLTDAEWDDIMAFFATSKMQNGGNFTSWVQVLISEVATEEALTTEPLYYAASFGMTAIVDRLIQSGVNVDAPGGRHGATPLIVASYRGQYPVVKRLLAAGADPSKKDCHGMTSLQWAKGRHNNRIAALLLESGDKDVPSASSDGNDRKQSLPWASSMTIRV
ncbi:hypothetical protein BBP40_011764 [Aspergillus hancockii]|nr:hypothetical protein BBP40_011764 [Aspergillus hancockii]